MKRLLLAAGLLSSLPLGAGAAESPLTLFTEGRFVEAETAGAARNDADGLAIAARAALADAVMHDEPCLDCLKQAADLARRAIATDPKRPEAHIYLAVALGYEARIIGDLAAQSRGFAREGQKELTLALDADPNDPWALAGMGSWNIEIVRGAGPALARWVFDASLETGEDLYARAFAQAPDNLVLRYQYALALAGLDLDIHRQEAQTELARTVAIAPTSAYERFVYDRAKELLDTLDRGDLAEAKRLIRRDRGDPL